MTLKYKITKKDKIHLFFREYYTIPGWKFIRLFGGPLVIMLGAFLMETEPDWQILAGIFIGYGVFYSFKPLLQVMLKFHKLTEETIELRIENGKLRVNDGLAKSEIDAKQIGNIIRTKGYVDIVLNLKEEFKIYVPLSGILEGNVDEFSRALR